MTVIDVRLVQLRTGTWRVRVDGRALPRLDAPTPAAALSALAKAIEGAAWALDAPEADVVGRLEVPPA